MSRTRCDRTDEVRAVCDHFTKCCWIARSKFRNSSERLYVSSGTVQDGRHVSGAADSGTGTSEFLETIECDTGVVGVSRRIR